MKLHALPALADSIVYQAMVRHVRDHNQNTEALDTLLWLLGSHPQLIGHARIFENLRSLLLLPMLEDLQLSWAKSWTASLPAIRELVVWFCAEKSRLAEIQSLAPLFAAPTNKAEHPLVGQHVDRHPVAAALWCQAASEFAAEYLELQGHVLVMYAEARGRAAEQRADFFTYAGTREFAPSPMNGGPLGRAVRELAKPELAPALIQLPRAPSTRQFANKLKTFTADFRDVDSTNRSRIDDALAAIKAYFANLEDMLKREGLHARTRKAGQRGASAGRQGYAPYADGSPILLMNSGSRNEAGGLITVAAVLEPSPEDEGEALETSGLSPQEVIEPLLHLYEYEELAAKASSLNLQQATMESHAQAMRYSTDHASAADVKALCLVANGAEQTARHAARGERAGAQQVWKGGLLAMQMLTLGWELERARALIVEYIDDLTADAIDRLLSRPIDRPRLLAHHASPAETPQVVGYLIPGLAPTYKTDLTPATAAIGRFRYEALLLPDATGVGQRALDLALAEGRASRTGDSLFGMEPKTAKAAVSLFMDQVQRQLQPPDSMAKRSVLTLSKIARAIPAAILSKCGDHVPAWIICWQTTKANEARLFYSQFSVDQLQQLYLGALRRMMPAGQVASTTATPLGQGDSPAGASSEARVLGARFVARRDAVMSLVERLQAAVNTGPDLQKISEIARYHNNYVLYTWLLQTMRTSLRAITLPTALLHAVERMALATGPFDRPQVVYTAISDKSGGLEDRARLVALQGDLLDQLDHFRAHTAVVLGRLEIAADWGNSSAECQRLFWLDSNIRPKPVTPAWLEDSLAALGFPAPANFSRGYLRTELLQAGCPPQAIDALLGHFNLGESPSARYASLDWPLQTKTIGMHLDALMFGLGLRSMRSQLLPAAVDPVHSPWWLPPGDLKPLPLPPTRISRKLPEKTPDFDTDSAHALWTAVSRQTSEQTRRQAPALLAFLRDADNPGARALLCCDGRHVADAASNESARQLEALVLEQYAKRRLTRLNVMHWLRMLHGAERRMRAAGHPIALTRLAYVRAELPSAFGSQNTWTLPAFHAWRAALERWVRELPSRRAARQQHPLTWCAAVVLSAITGAMMLDRTLLRHWLLTLSSEGDRALATANGHGCLHVNLPSTLPGGTQSRVCFLDPLTELLVLRLPSLPHAIGLSELRQPMRDLLLGEGVPQAWIPRSWSPVLRAARTYWSTQAPQFVVQAANRGFATDALRMDCWPRLFQHELLLLPLPGRLAAEEPLDDGVGAAGDLEGTAVAGSLEEGDHETDPLPEDAIAAHPWLADLSHALDTDDLPSAMAKLSQELTKLERHPTAQRYATWLIQSLKEYAGTDDSRTPRGVSRNLLRLVPRLLIEFGDTWPGDLLADERDRRMQQLLDAESALDGRREMSAMLATLLPGNDGHRAGGPNWFDDPDLDGEDGPRVDARIVSIDALVQALALARSGIEPFIAPDEREVVEVVMMLAGRTGTRPTEWLGLRLMDVSDVKGLELLVRPHPERPLKSANAERRVPISALLGAGERRQLRAWMARRRDEVAHLPLDEQQRAPLFHLDKWQTAAIRVQRLTTLMTRLLRQASGDPLVRVYSLRHTFCTWTCLALTAPESEPLLHFLQDLPQTCAWIRRGTVLRRRLLSGKIGPERRSLHALSRLMGHMSPAVTLAHYTHLMDLLQFDVVTRQSERVEAAVLVAASCLPASTAYDRSARSVQSLVEATRASVGAAPAATRPAFRVHDPLGMGSSRWSADKVRSVLNAWLTSAQPPARIATHFGVTEADVRRMAEAAAELGPLLGEPLRPSALAGVQATCCPPIGRLNDAQRRSRDDLFDRAVYVWRADPALAEQGVRLHLQNTDQGMNDVVFTDATSLETYLAFLDACSVAPVVVRICLRRTTETDVELPEWAKGRLGSFGECVVHVIRPRSMASFAGYRRWLGLKMLDEQGRGAGVWLSRAWFYAAVAARARAT
jgi:integrase